MLVFWFYCSRIMSELNYLVIKFDTPMRKRAFLKGARVVWLIITKFVGI